MTTSLDRFIDPANYHPDAVAAAGEGAVADVAPGLLIIRLGIELHRANRSGAEDVIARLELVNAQGHERFQMMTAKLILALWTHDDAIITSALNRWLDVRKTAPGNWREDVLAAPELAAFVAKLDRAQLALPTLKRAPITKADRAMVKDLSAAREQAVTENLHWLRKLGFTGTAKSIAKAYHIAYANHHLREVTLTRRPVRG